MKNRLFSTPFTLVVLALVTALVGAAVAGCAAAPPTPSSVAKQTLDAIKSQDLETLQKNYAGNADEFNMSEVTGNMSGVDLSTLSDDEKAFAQKIIEVMTSFDYELLGESIDGDTATVEAKITTYNLGEALSGSLQEYLKEVLAAAFSGTEMSEEEMAKAFVEKFTAKLDAQTEKTYTTNTTFKLSKVEGEWKMDSFNEENTDAILGGMISSLSNLADTFGSQLDAA